MAHQKKPQKKNAKTAKKKNGSSMAKRNAPCVVVYGVDWESERGGLLHRVIRELGFRKHDVSPDRLYDQVGSCAGLVGFHPSLRDFGEDAPTCEFLLLCNLNKRQLDDFLMALKIVGVSIPHKAILTKENKSWRFIDLMEQVAQEHEHLVAAAAAKQGSDGTDGDEAAEPSAANAAAAGQEVTGAATEADAAAEGDAAGAASAGYVSAGVASAGHEAVGVAAEDGAVVKGDAADDAAADDATEGDSAGKGKDLLEQEQQGC